MASISATLLPTAALQAYLETELGRTNVSRGKADWWGNSKLFESDGVFSRGPGATLDFDTDDSADNDWFIKSVSFDWGVNRVSADPDFGLDVWSDHDDAWHVDVFTVSGLAAGRTRGPSGLIPFDSTWEVTRLRFHDGRTWAVGMDNLVLNDNQGSTPIPEPGTFVLFGVAAAGACVHRRRRKAPKFNNSAPVRLRRTGAFSCLRGCGKPQAVGGALRRHAPRANGCKRAQGGYWSQSLHSEALDNDFPAV